jgi:hypothetical protein
MPEEKLDLFEFAARLMAKPGTRPAQIVRSKPGDSTVPGCFLNDRPDHLWGEAIPLCAPRLVNGFEQRTRTDSGGRGPFVDGPFHPVWHRNRADVTAFPTEIGDYSMPFSELDIFQFQSRSFRPSQSATNQDSDHGTIPSFLWCSCDERAD